MSTFFHSIRFRLLLWFTAILVLVLIIFSAFIYFNQARDLEDDALARLERRLVRLQGSVRISLHEQNGQLVLPEDILEDTDALALIDSNGQVLASYGTFPTDNVAQIASQATQNHSEYDEAFESSATWVDNNSAYAYAVTPIFGESGKTSLLVLGGPLDPEGRLQGLLTS